MRTGIACGPVLAGRIEGDCSMTSVQGPLLGAMVLLSKTNLVEAPIRLNRAAYRRVSILAEFARFEDPRVGEAWSTFGEDLVPEPEFTNQPHQ